jgi:hypothetical protein
MMEVLVIPEGNPRLGALDSGCLSLQQCVAQIGSGLLGDIG